MIHLYVQLDDSILKTIESSSDEGLKESKDIILPIRRRDLYQVIIHMGPHNVSEAENGNNICFAVLQWVFCSEGETRKL